MWKYLVALLMTSVSLHGQEKSPRKVSLLFQLNAGKGYTTTSLSQDKATDDLLYYNGNGFLARLSGYVFWKEKWGLCAMYQSRDVASKQYHQFNTVIENQYPAADYLITYNDQKDLRYDPTPTDASDPTVESGMIGIAYNMGKAKFRFIPRVMAGVTSIQTRNRYVEIKKKNSNDYAQVYYQQSNFSNYVKILTMNAGFSLVYSIYKGVGLNVDVNYAQLFPVSGAIRYNIDTTTLGTTNQISYRVTSYSQVTGQLNVSLGLNVFIRWYKRTAQ